MYHSPETVCVEEFTDTSIADVTPNIIQALTKATTSMLELARSPDTLELLVDSYDASELTPDDTTDLAIHFERVAIDNGRAYECRSRAHTGLGIIDEVRYDIWLPEREGYITSWAMAIRGITSSFWPADRWITLTRGCVQTTPSRALSRTAETYNLLRLRTAEQDPVVKREDRWFMNGRQYMPPRRKEQD